MALEDALLKLAEAINNHAEAFKVNAGYVPPVLLKPEKDEAPAKKSTPATTAVEPQDTQTGSAIPAETTTSSSEETTDTPEVETDTGAEEKTVDMALLKEQFLKLVNADRSKAEGVLATLGFPKLNLVPANLHNKAYELIQGALNG